MYLHADKATLATFAKTVCRLVKISRDDLTAMARPALTCDCALSSIHVVHTDTACVARWCLVFPMEARTILDRSLVTAWDLDDMRRHHDGHWFDDFNNRYFRTKYGRVFNGPAGVFFVTSESDERGPRRYTVRSYCTITGDVDTIGEFQQYATATAANRAAQRCANGSDA